VQLRSIPATHGALLASFVLFIIGGAFGVAINGPNVRIPAHYHGSIVAVTLALMGLAYYLLPKLGGADVSGWRLARWQPWLYGIGQILHITGLAVSGGYGVLRKAVGDTGEGGWQVQAALGMMGGGGLLAIIGGLSFVVVMVKGFRRCSVRQNVA
jgi:cytochrome c oxidase subunit I